MYDKVFILILNYNGELINNKVMKKEKAILKCNHKWGRPDEWYGDFDEYRIFYQICKKCGLIHLISESIPGFWGIKIKNLDRYQKEL